MVNELTKIKNHCVTELKSISITNTQGWVSIASDVLSVLYYSIKLKGLREDFIMEDVMEQSRKKYAKLTNK